MLPRNVAPASRRQVSLAARIMSQSAIADTYLIGKLQRLHTLLLSVWPILCRKRSYGESCLPARISRRPRRRWVGKSLSLNEKYLDVGVGACFLRNDAVAKVVADSLWQFQGTRYQLFAWCVMPNHVHTVFQTLVGNTLARILHSWKSFSAKQANQILHRSAEFWQREYYDRLVRDISEFHRAVQYVVDNPKRAGLKDWPWVWPKV